MLLTLPCDDTTLCFEATLIDARERARLPSPSPIALGPFTPPHTLLTFVIEGTNCLTRRGQSVTLHLGDAMLLWPHEEYRVLLAPARAFKAINVVFEIQSEAVQLLAEVARADEDTSELRRAMEACARSVAGGRSALAQVEFAATLLALSRLSLLRREAALSPAVRRALDLVRRHPERPPSRDQIAAIAGVSPSHLSHLVKRETGATLSSHIGRARVARARELIHDTSLNFGEIARALDMDLPRFSRLFKQVTGAAPRDYARAARLDGFQESAQSDK